MSASISYSTLDEANNGDHSLSFEIDGPRNGNRGSGLFRKSATSTDMKEPLTSSSADLERGTHRTDDRIDEDDPFYVFQEDLYRKLDLVDEALTEYMRIVNMTDTAVNTHALKDAKKALKRHIKNAESTWKDVNMTVTLVESQRDKFQHIDSAELYERRSMVGTAKDRIAKAKSEINSEKVKSKLLDDERAKSLRRQKQQQQMNGKSEMSESEKEDASFLADSQAQTSLLMQSQDETLDELGEAVTKVGEMASGIQEEIGLQNKILTELEDDLADAEESLGLVMGKLAKFLKTKNKMQLVTILILCAVVVVLFFLLIYV